MKYYKKLFSLFLILLCLYAVPAKALEFTSSSLPIIIIDTADQPVPDEPKITAQMKIVYNRDGSRNNVSGPFDEYDGKIGIETRGATSQTMFPKKPYALETRDDSGDDLKVSLLDMPEESDWVLHAPYSDKTLMRNVLACKIARDMGQYASRTRFCELLLNGQYQGVYVLMEKVKRDKNRVNIAKLTENDTIGDDLTGGYIVKIDKKVGAETDGWFSPYQSNGRNIYYQYHYPDGSDILPVQQTYIQEQITRFESIMSSPDYKDPTTGYATVIDPDTFIDFLIVNEISRNVDGYRLSTFLYKDKDSNDSRLKMGPVWDFNIGFGNADYFNGWKTEGWQFDFAVTTDGNQIPFWWKKLLADPAFVAKLHSRWQELRRNVLRTDTLIAGIDALAAVLDEAQARNFERWPVLGRRIWPNRYVGRTWDDETGYLKQWLSARLAWMDTRWSGTPDPGDVDGADGVTLQDAILVLQLCAGLQPSGLDISADADGDGKLGPGDAVYILRHVSEQF